MTACNGEAHAGAGSRAVSSTSKDEAGAAAARQAGAEAVERPGGAAAVTESSDPQIHGMHSKGAKDAAYRATYRVCMRRSGF